MDDQALLEGIVVFSDEDGPGKQKEKKSTHLKPSIALLNVFSFQPFLLINNK